jgi:hypothetical protein
MQRPITPPSLPLAVALLLAGAGLVGACGSGEGEERPVTTDAAAERGAFGAADVALICASPRLEFGTVWEGAHLEGEFELGVEGSEDLVIQAVRTDCGCAAPTLEVVGEGGVRTPYVLADPLPPGTRLLLSVRYDTRGKPGSQPRRVSLYCNQAGGLALFTLLADVRPGLLVDPPSLSAGVISVEEERRVELQVRSATGDRLRLEHRRRAVPEQLQVTLEPIAPDEEGRAERWAVSILLQRGMPKGVHRYPIHLVSDRENPDATPAADGTRPFFTIIPDLEVEVVGRFRIHPPALDFGVVRSEETVARTLRLTCLDGDFDLGEPRVRLIPLKPDQPFPLGRTAHIQLFPVEGENAWMVQLLLDGLDKDVEQTILARLVIETGHPAEPEIEARVSAIHLLPTPSRPPGGAPTDHDR